MRKTKTNNVLTRTKSVQKPSAQSTTLCEPVNRWSTELNRCLHVVETNKELALSDRALISLMFRNGLRVSEVLRIQSNDVSQDLRIWLRSSKGSRDRIIQVADYEEYWHSFRSSNISVGQIYSRYYFYRLFKKLGFSLKFKTNEHASVTHYARYVSIKSLDENFKKKELIQEFIGHKKESNTKRYIEKQ